MSDFENPYNSPEAIIVPEKNQSAGNLTETALRYLKEASPWLRFIGIFGFITCGFMAIWAIIAIIGTVSAAAFLSDFWDFPIWLISPLYFALAAVVFFPSLFTYNFGTIIRKYLYSNSDDDLEQAFKNNKSLWKFYGILCIVYIALIPVVLIAVIIVGIASSAGMF